MDEYGRVIQHTNKTPELSCQMATTRRKVYVTGETQAMKVKNEAFEDEIETHDIIVH